MHRVLATLARLHAPHQLVAELELERHLNALEPGDGAPHLAQLLLRRLELGQLLLLPCAGQEQHGEAIVDLILLRVAEAAGDAAPQDPPRQPRRLGLAEGQSLVEHAPHLASAPGVERRADAGPQAEAGQPEPALLVIGRALAGIGDVGEGVEQGAGRVHRPLVAPGLEQLLELAGERRQQRGLAAERRRDLGPGLVDAGMGCGGGGAVIVAAGRPGRRLGAAGAHVEGQAPPSRHRALGGAALAAPHLDRTQLGDRHLQVHRHRAAAAGAQHRDDGRQLEQVGAVVDGLGAAVAHRHDGAGLIGARRRRVQLEAHRPVGHQLEVAVELDGGAVVEALARQTHRAGLAGGKDAEIEGARGAAADAGGEAAPHQPVVGGAHGHRQLGRDRGQLPRRRRVGLPARELIDHPGPQHRRRHGAAVEQHGVDALGAVAGQERRQVPRHRGVAGVGQPHLLQAAAATHRGGAALDHREEAVEQHPLRARRARSGRAACRRAACCRGPPP